MKRNSSIAIRKFLLAMLIIAIAFVAFAFLTPGFKSKINTFLANSSFANILGYSNDENITALAVNVTNYDTTITVLASEVETGSGTGWSSHTYNLDLSQDILAAAKLGRLSIYAEAQVRIGWTAGAKAQGYIQILNSSEGEIARTPQCETSANYSGSKYATTSGTINIPTNLGSRLILRMNNSTTRSGAAHYTTYIRIKINKRISQDGGPITIDSGATNGVVNNHIKDVNFKVSSNIGIKEAKFRYKLPNGSWQDLQTFSYNSNGVATYADTAQTKIISLNDVKINGVVRDYPLGTQFQVTFKNNYRTEYTNSPTVTFKAKYSLSLSGGGTAGVDYGFSTTNTAKPTSSTPKSYTWNFDSTDTEFYALVSDPPADGYYFKNGTCSNPSIDSILTGSVASIKFSTTNRNTTSLYSSANISVTIYTSTFGMKHKDGVNVIYNGVVAAHSNSHYSKISNYIEPNTTLPSGLACYFSRTSTDVRYMTDAGTWGYKAEIKNTAGGILGTTTISSASAASVEVKRRDITLSFDFSSLVAAEKVYDGNNFVTTTQENGSFYEVGSDYMLPTSNLNAVHSADGFSLTRTNGQYSNAYVENEAAKQTTYTFTFSTSITARANNYATKMVFNQGSNGGSYVSSGVLSNLAATNTITVTRIQGNKIKYKMLANTVISAVVNNKVYDTTTAAVVKSVTLSTGVSDGLDCTWNSSNTTATFRSANAGSRTADISNISFTFNDNTKASNYKVGGTLLTTTATFTSTYTAEISPAPINLVITNTQNSIVKTYDASLTIPVGELKYGYGTNQPFAVDAANMTIRNSIFHSVFESINAGTNKEVIYQEAIGARINVMNEVFETASGFDHLKTNYIIVNPETQKAGIGKITPKIISMTMSVPQGVTKIFDWTNATRGVYLTKNSSSLSDIPISFSFVGLVGANNVEAAPSVRMGALFTSWNAGITQIEANAAITSTDNSHLNFEIPQNTIIRCSAIIAPKPITHHTITKSYAPSLSSTFIYNGQEHKPTVTLQDSQKNSPNGGNNATLTETTHYTVAYSKNIVVGQAEINISPQYANYETGSEIDDTFSIQKASIVVSTDAINIVYGTSIGNADLTGTVTHATDASYTNTIEGTWQFENLSNSLYNSGNHSPTVRFILSSDSFKNFIGDTSTATSSYSSTTVSINVSKRAIDVTAIAQSQIFGDKYEDISKLFTTSDPAGVYANGIVLNNGMPDDPNITLKTSARQLFNPTTPENTYNKAIVGEYDILLDSVANNNYIVNSVNYTKAKYTVTKRAIVVSPNINDATTKSKVYGNPDPVFAYLTELKNRSIHTYQAHVLVPNYELEGAISRSILNETGPKAGENVGNSYTFTAGDITSELLNPNYTVEFNSNGYSFEITRRDIELKMNAVAQIYGDDFVDLSDKYTITQGNIGVNNALPFGDTLVGIPFRVTQNYSITSSRDVGSYYVVNLPTESNSINNNNNSNYNILPDPNFDRKANYTIQKRGITIIPKYNEIDNIRVYKTTSQYGNSLPVVNEFDFEYTGDASQQALASWDTITGSLRVNGATNSDNICIGVGDFIIDASTIKNAWDRNYNILLSGDPGTGMIPSQAKKVLFRVNKRPIVVSPAVVGIDFGETPPAESTLRFAEVGGDGLVLGNTIGQPKPVGESQPTVSIRLGYEKDAQGYIPTALGMYNIIPTSSLENVFYLITFDGTNKFRINELEAHIEPIQNQKIVYGQVVPTITYLAWTRSGNSIDVSKLNGSLEISYSGTYATPGSYEILQGTLSNNVDGANPNPNYIIIFNSKYDNFSSECIGIDPVNFTVNKKSIVLTPNENQYKFFNGESLINEGTYGYTLSDSLVGSDILTGSLSRTDGTNIGNYPYNISTIAAVDSNDAPVDYYNISLQPGAFYQIRKRPIYVIPDSGISSVYGAAQDSEITYTVKARSPLDPAVDGGLIDGYPLTGKLDRDAGKNVAFYKITQGSLAGSQYDVWLDPTVIYYEISKLPLEITASATTAFFGEHESIINYRFTGGVRPPYGETLNGTLVRDNVATITVGEYDILQGTITDANNPNYTITFRSAKYRILPRVVTIMPNMNQGKIYGEDDPDEFTYTPTATYAGSAIVNGYPLNGSLERVQGNSVGVYAITQGTLSNDLNGTNPNPNYRIIFETSGIFTISRKSTIITVDGAVEVDGVVTKTLLYNGFEQTIEMSHDNNDTPAPLIPTWRDKYKFVGSYDLTIRTSATANYSAGVLHLVVVVEKAVLADITAADINSSLLTKTYGANDPTSFYVEKDGLGEDTDKIVATFSRETGENAGKYNFIASSISISNTNYTISFADNANVDAFTITKRQISIEPKKFTKIYGTTDPALEESLQTGFLNDTLNISYIRNGSDLVGKYDLTDLSWNNDNYNLTFVSTSNENKFEIIRRNLYIFADNKESAYNQTEKQLTYSLAPTTATEGLIASDNLTGAVACDLEEKFAGVYDITQGTLTNDSNTNYNIIFVGGHYTITQIEITITPDSFVLEYGDAPQDLTYTYSPAGAIVGTDSLEGELSVADKVTVGNYDILQGTLDNNEGRNRNYKIIFVSGATYRINIRSVSVLPMAKTVNYGDNYVIEYTIDSGSLLEGDTLNGALGHTGNIAVGNYKITIGTLNSANINYNVSLSDDNIDFIISPRAISIRAIDITQEYGANEKTLPYLITSGSLAYSDILHGSLRRASGYSVGTYAINQGSLTNTNYTITFEGATYKITKAKLTVDIHDVSTAHGAPIAIDQNGYTIVSGRVFFNDDLEIQLTKDPLEDSIGEYAIIGTYNNENYEITFIDGVYTIRKWDANILIESTFIVKKYDGKPIHIEATTSSNQPVEIYMNEVKVNNSFIEPGKYHITLKSNATSEYNAPEPINVDLTILRDKLATTNLGIDIVLKAEDGFDPNYVVELQRNEKDEPVIVSALTKSQKLVRSYKISVIDSENNEEVVEGKSTLRIKAPEALSGEEAIKLIVFDSDNNYKYRIAKVDKDGYVTLDVENVSNVAFIQESSSNMLWYIIIGVIALIVIATIVVYALKRRA